ncbi:SelL-related redox protein [Gimesia algae]|uniref:AhpC/TSA family protein n=1 Tax=Gimesia algae TaxID=2527971 RepID=A0A517VGD5_9PLAN|nr:SelL-related redox protein [Gimesia algae]QDT92069.1 AhpC/TSA family protein [Gimesia algae]
MNSDPFREALSRYPSSQGQTLTELSDVTPVLVVFLRHGGCPFCRQVLDQLKSLSAQLAERHLQLAIVHMMDDKEAIKLLSHYSLQNVSSFSDPERKLYELFQVKRGSLAETVGPAVWWSGFKTTVLSGYLPGIPGKDVQQLGAAVILDQGNVVASYFSQNSADLPDWDQLLSCELPRE